MFLLWLALMSALVHGWRWHSWTAGISHSPKEVVYGIELTHEGASFAVSYSNGSFDGIASIPGSSEYIDLVQQWYKLCVDKNASAIEAEYPSPSSNVTAESNQRSKRKSPLLLSVAWIARLVGQRQRCPDSLIMHDDFSDDRATKILADLMTQVRNTTIRFAEEAGVEERTYRPFAEIALPAWFFKTASVFPEEETDPKLREHTKVTAQHLRSLTRRISTAVHRAGFRRSADPDHDLEVQPYRDERLLGPLSAPEAALTQALGGSCEGEPWDIERCVEMRDRKSAAIAIRMDDIGPTLMVTGWASSKEGYPWDRAEWKVWEIPLPVSTSSSDMHIHVQAIVDGLYKMLSEVSGGIANNDTRIIILPLGRAWLPDLRQALATTPHLELRPLRFLKPIETEFLAALEAAVEARIHYRVYFTCGLRYDPEDFVQHHQREL